MNENKQWENLTMTPFMLGWIENNSYLLTDTAVNECVVIDPSFHPDAIVDTIQKKSLTLKAVWLTHGHFDHFVGTKEIIKKFPTTPIFIDFADLEIVKNGGESDRASSPITQGCPIPTNFLKDNMKISVGSYEFTVMSTPGHSPGSCCFYFKPANWLFTGDLIFYHSYGRTDLAGGDETALFQSIREKVLSLPDETIIFPGHNDFTTVCDERRFY